MLTNMILNKTMNTEDSNVYCTVCKNTVEDGILYDNKCSDCYDNEYSGCYGGGCIGGSNG